MGSVGMAKKLLTWVANAFAIYYVLAFPNDAAKVVRSAALGLEAAAHRLSDFVTSLA
ncbi:MAG TPA: hypothetical protein VKP64_15415 [Mycobacteriales bacterium]|nr:hypothetical protein [Mycobacteriales bacterium]